jgi:hypothetical protein
MNADPTLLPQVQRVRALLDDLVWQCEDWKSQFLSRKIVLYEAFEKLENLAIEARAQLLGVARKRGRNVTAISGKNALAGKAVTSC